jgi:cystathionine beta-lyase/cystathionine gamma-synthase
MDIQNLKFASRTVHNGEEPNPINGAIMPPIWMTSTYAQEYPAKLKGYDYTRGGNPSFTSLEKALAALEYGKHAIAFSSGLGATTALLSRLESGDTVVAIDGLYGGTFRLFTRIFKKFGIHFRFVSPDDAEHALDADASMLFFETPTNPLLGITDIEKLCSHARKQGVLSVVDNTFATPCFQNPLNLGADIVLHSTTKYISGHSDVIGGALITNNDTLKEELDFARMATGVNPSPFDCWATLRGLKTLAVRLDRQQENAMALAQFLEGHPRVKRVFYPGLPSHPQHTLAKKQMSGFSGIVSCEFDLALEDSKQLVSSFQLFTLAESLGGIESLVCHPTSMTHASIPAEERKRMGLNDGLIRFSLGIEDKRDLIADISGQLDHFKSANSLEDSVYKASLQE